MSKKDVFWFTHDAGAARDIKLLKLRSKMGYFGIGMYWTFIEILREQPDYKYPSDKESKNMLNLMFGLNEEKVELFLNECYTLNLLTNKYDSIYSESLIYRMNLWETKKRNGSKPKAKLKRNGSESTVEQNRIEQNKEKGTSPTIAVSPHSHAQSVHPPSPPDGLKDTELKTMALGLTEEQFLALKNIPVPQRTRMQGLLIYECTLLNKFYNLC